MIPDEGRSDTIGLITDAMAFQRSGTHAADTEQRITQSRQLDGRAGVV